MKPNIFLITLDALRRDFVSAYLNDSKNHITPFIDKLAKEGIQYMNAYSAGLWTDPSISSIYSGVYPNQHRILAGLDTKLKCKTLAEELSDSGYHTVMVGQGSGYISEDRNIVKGFDKLVNTFDIKKLFNDFGTIRDISFLRLFKTLAFNALYGKDCRVFYSLEKAKHAILNAPHEPLFLHLHLWFLSRWYNLPRRNTINYFFKKSKFSFREIISLRRKIKKIQKDNIRVDYQYLCYPEYFSEREIELIRFLYEVSAHYLDSRLSKFFKWLGKKGYFENSVFILMSDHGENLGEHELMSHNFSAHQEITSIPLIIWAPNYFEKSVNKEYVSQTDLASSLINYLKIDSEAFQSEEVIDIFESPSFEEENSRYVFFEDGKPAGIKNSLEKINSDLDFSKWDYAIKGLINNDYKYIITSTKVEYLYNLKNDKTESKNLAKDFPKKTQKYRKAIFNKLGDFDYQNPTHI